MKRLSRQIASLALLGGVASGTALAGASDPFIDALAEPGSVGIGAASRIEHSPYLGEGTRGDLLPVYLYEGRRFYLHAYRAGIKYEPVPTQRFDLFITHRFEGMSSQSLPPALAGLSRRDTGVDVGASWRWQGRYGALSGEFLHDALDASRGAELRLGYDYDWRSGRLRLQPQLGIAWRSARLNNYYYGVSDDEAIAGRPAYRAGAGFNSSIGLFASWDITPNARVFGSLGLTRWSNEVRASPIVEHRSQLTGMFGVMYDFSNQHEPWPEHKPVILRVLRGASTDCNFINTVTLRCASIHTKDDTGIDAVEVGRTFVEHLNGWPVSVAGFLGLMRHRERGFQPDFVQLNAYLRAYYYGFPWSSRLRTRVGFGAGLSYARRVPMPEVIEQARRGRPTSRLLNYLDPTVDVNLGDLTGARFLRDTLIGVGISHRSGIFGSSQLLGNVNGGSNYLYTYLEWTL